jgi:hypothetical protein
MLTDITDWTVETEKKIATHQPKLSSVQTKLARARLHRMAAELIDPR